MHRPRGRDLLGVMEEKQGGRVGCRLEWTVPAGVGGMRTERWPGPDRGGFLGSGRPLRIFILSKLGSHQAIWSW